MKSHTGILLLYIMQAVLNNNLGKLEKLIKDGMPVDSRCACVAATSGTRTTSGTRGSFL